MKQKKETILIYLNRTELGASEDNSHHEVKTSFFWEVEKGEIIAVEIEEGKTSDLLKNMSCPWSRTSRLNHEYKVMKFEEGFSLETNEKDKRWVAKFDGVLTCDEGVHRIQKELRVKGSAGIHTGHIVTKYSVVIDEDVDSLTTIKTKGSLFVGGCVSNKVHLEVDQDLEVKEGVVGDNTSIHVGGDAYLNFIQESTVIAKGNISIQGYAFNAHIYSQGNILVEGRHVKVGDRGAIVGGVINSLKNMEIHSAGCGLNRTSLVSGVDLLILQKSDQLKVERSKTKKFVLKCQDDLGLNEAHPEKNLKVMIANYGQEWVKEQLGSIKFSLDKLDQIKVKISCLNDQIDKMKQTSSRIICRQFLSPEIWIRVGDLHTQLKKYTLGPVMARIDNKELDIVKHFEGA